MLKADRAARILSHVAGAGGADVHALTDLLGVSGATIRCDLQELHDKSLLRRTRGGAVTEMVSLELPLRHGARNGRKGNVVSRAAAGLIPTARLSA